jgi:hypothetical protein
VLDVNAGGVASFDVVFVGEGIPHRFDLQFVREGTSVVLGSIPVVLGTPIPGDGYEFEDLEEGEFGEDVDFGSHYGSLPPNAAPTFIGGADETIAEDAGPQTVANWATSISPGAEIEAWQQVEFNVSNDNPALFLAPPALSAAGTLSYTPGPNANGSAVVTVVLRDNGGREVGGVDASAPQTFTISVTPVNDLPQAVDDAYEVYLNRSLTIAVAGVLGNDSDVDNPALTAVVEAPPANGTLVLNADGSFAYTPTLWFSGVDTFTYRASDGMEASAIATVNIHVAWIPGDLNADGAVNRVDAALLAGGFGRSVANRSQGDVDGDGVVGLRDLGLLTGQMGAIYALPPAPSPAAAPNVVGGAMHDAVPVINLTALANRGRRNHRAMLPGKAVDEIFSTSDGEKRIAAVRRRGPAAVVFDQA